MKRTLTMFVCCTFAVMLRAQTVTQTLYFDFGGPTTELKNPENKRGDLTEGADQNGHYWNNVCTNGYWYLYPNTVFTLVNADNEPTGFDLLVNARFMSNGTAAAGGLVNPSADALGDLAVATATEDYIFMEAFQHHNFITLRGLDPAKGYRFHVFGCRANDQVRSADFEFRGENVWSGYHQMSGAGLGDNGYNGNNNSVLESDIVFPDRDGNIRMTMKKTYSDRMVHINAMKMEEIEGVENPHAAYRLSQTMYVDFGENNNARGHQTEGADQFGHYWNNLVSAPSGSDYIIPKGTVIDLVNADNNSTGYQAEMVTVMYTNGVAAGGVNNPKEENLGDLAVTTATEDYVWLAVDGKRQVRFCGLDKKKAYKFYIFGSRITEETGDRSSRYTLEGQDSWTTILTTSGRCIGGRDENGTDIQGNVLNVAISDYVFPDNDGNILFSLERYVSYGHLNLIKIEEYDGAVRPVEALDLKEISLTGTASENGEDVSLQRIGTSTVFETYLRLQEGTYLLKGITTDEREVSIGAGAEAGVASEDGEAFVCDVPAVVRVRFDSKNMSISVTPVELYLKGNIVPQGTVVEYEGNGVWKSEAAMTIAASSLFSNKYFYFAFNDDEQLAVKRLTGSRTKVAMPGEGFDTENIRINEGTYTVTLDMRNYLWDIDAPVDENRISAFGSSVCNGQGATAYQGYAYNYGKMMTTRYESGLSETPFYVSGISIGGNTTINLLNRYDEMIHDFGRYVIIGLSMGNEGLHEASDKQVIMNQFAGNLQQLISMMREDGKIPVVMNNYTRGDYTEADYESIKAVNLQIHQWDVPSVNTLGAIDNGAGQWADGYMADTAHPTTQGHMEFFYAMPPSLFDAIKAGKPLPQRDGTGEMELKDRSTLTFKGEDTVHPFTVSLKVKGGEAGNLFQFSQLRGSAGVVSINATGNAVYTSPAGDQLVSTRDLGDGDWHTVTLTYYYAQKRLLFYVDEECAGELLAQTLLPRQFTVGDDETNVARSLSELFFWRSALSPDEVKAVADGKMLKSSLEIYAPLSEASKDGVDNLAQSLNTVAYNQGIPSGVSAVSANESTSAPTPLYSVSGQRVDESHKGIVVRKGQKVVNR